jgi:hypothetical protein
MKRAPSKPIKFTAAETHLRYATIIHITGYKNMHLGNVSKETRSHGIQYPV